LAEDVDDEDSAESIDNDFEELANEVAVPKGGIVHCHPMYGIVAVMVAR
jgi:hypothetical protein